MTKKCNGCSRDLAATGFSRLGLLCQRCNTGLGKLGDDPLRAANMLARYAIITNAN